MDGKDADHGAEVTAGVLYIKEWIGPEAEVGIVTGVFEARVLYMNSRVGIGLTVVMIKTVMFPIEVDGVETKNRMNSTADTIGEKREEGA
jgi:hypothetical protein